MEKKRERRKKLASEAQLFACTSFECKRAAHQNYLCTILYII